MKSPLSERLGEQARLSVAAPSDCWVWRWKILRSLGFGGRLLLIAPSVERHGSRVALQFSPIMNKRLIRICGTEDQSLRVRLRWKQEELAKNLRQMGWPIIWKNARRVESSSSRSKPATRAVLAQRAFYQ